MTTQEIPNIPRGNMVVVVTVSDIFVGRILSVSYKFGVTSS